MWEHNKKEIDKYQANEEEDKEEFTIRVGTPPNFDLEKCNSSAIRQMSYSEFIIKDPFNMHPCKGIDELGQSYKGEFFTEVSKLLYQDGFKFYRGVRGDGNCYFRSVAYAYIEFLVMTKKIKALEDLIRWVNSENTYYSFPKNEKIQKEYKDAITSHLKELILYIQSDSQLQELFNLVQKMFLMSDAFDKGMVFFIRNLTKKFILDHRARSLNGLPIEVAAEAEEDPQAKTLDAYIEKILIKMGTDAQGFLLNVVPIALRINIYIVNIDTSNDARSGKNKKINVQDCKAEYDDILMKGNDNLNFHNETLFVLRKDGHYDAIYSPEYMKFDILQFKDNDKDFIKIYKDHEHLNLIPQDGENKKLPLGLPQQNNMYKVSCCKRNFDKQMLITQIETNCENGDIFMIEGKRQIMACQCGARYRKQDLIDLFPDKKYQINQLYDDLDPNSQKNKPKPPSPKIEKAKQYEKFINPQQEQKNKCSLTEYHGKLQQNENIIILTCNCSYHYECLYYYIENITNGEFQLNKVKRQLKQYKQIQCPQFKLGNCQAFPSIPIIYELIETIILMKRGEYCHACQISLRLSFGIQLKLQTIQMHCCYQEQEEEKLLTNIQQFRIQHEGYLFHVYAKFFITNIQGIQGPQCLCGNEMSSEDLANILKIPKQDVENEKMYLQIMDKIQFKCFECFKDQLIIGLVSKYSQTLKQEIKQHSISLAYKKGLRKINQKITIEVNNIVCKHGIKMDNKIYDKLCKEFKQFKTSKELQDQYYKDIIQQWPDKVNQQIVSNFYLNDFVKCVCQNGLAVKFCPYLCSLCNGCYNEFTKNCKCCHCNKKVLCNICLNSEFQLVLFEDHPEYKVCYECSLRTFFDNKYDQFNQNQLNCKKIVKNQQRNQCKQIHGISYQILAKILNYENENDSNSNIRINASNWRDHISTTQCNNHKNSISIKTNNQYLSCYQCFLENPQMNDWIDMQTVQFQPNKIEEEEEKEQQQQQFNPQQKLNIINEQLEVQQEQLAAVCAKCLLQSSLERKRFQNILLQYINALLEQKDKFGIFYRFTYKENNKILYSCMKQVTCEHNHPAHLQNIQACLMSLGFNENTKQENVDKIKQIKNQNDNALKIIEEFPFELKHLSENQKQNILESHSIVCSKCLKKVNGSEYRLCADQCCVICQLCQEQENNLQSKLKVNNGPENNSEEQRKTEGISKNVTQSDVTVQNSTGEKNIQELQNQQKIIQPPLNENNEQDNLAQSLGYQILKHEEGKEIDSDGQHYEMINEGGIQITPATSGIDSAFRENFNQDTKQIILNTNDNNLNQGTNDYSKQQLTLNQEEKEKDQNNYNEMMFKQKAISQIPIGFEPHCKQCKSIQLINREEWQMKLYDLIRQTEYGPDIVRVSYKNNQRIINLNENYFSCIHKIPITYVDLQQWSQLYKVVILDQYNSLQARINKLFPIELKRNMLLDLIKTGRINCNQCINNKSTKTCQKECCSLCEQCKPKQCKEYIKNKLKEKLIQFQQQMHSDCEQQWELMNNYEYILKCPECKKMLCGKCEKEMLSENEIKLNHKNCETKELQK